MRINKLKPHAFNIDESCTQNVEQKKPGARLCRYDSISVKFTVGKTNLVLGMRIMFTLGAR